jgi:hypothetical protein
MPRCRCPESRRPLLDRRWAVVRRNEVASAFEGYRPRFSRFSDLFCFACQSSWRSAGAYVAGVRDAAGFHWLQETPWSGRWIDDLEGTDEA